MSKAKILTFKMTLKYAKEKIKSLKKEKEEVYYIIRSFEVKLGFSNLSVLRSICFGVFYSL